MPWKRELYPANWREITARIRKRAGWRCEWIEDGVRCEARDHRQHPLTGSLVFLTVMHRDHNPANCKESNLLAACQYHHLRYDAKHHAHNAAQTRRKKKVAAGQKELPL